MDHFKEYTAKYDNVKNFVLCVRHLRSKLDYLPYTHRHIDNTYHDTFFDCTMGTKSEEYLFKTDKFIIKCIIEGTKGIVCIYSGDNQTLVQLSTIVEKVFGIDNVV